MLSRHSRRLLRGAVTGSLVLLLIASACKKRSEAPGSGGSGGAPDAVETNLFLFANLRAQDLINSPIVEEIKKNRLPIEGKEMSWDQLEQMAVSEVGVKPSRVESITFAYPDVPDKRSDEIRFILIVASQDEVNQQALKTKFARGGQDKRQGYSVVEPGLLMHFPDAKTIVVVHESLIAQYESGYAKDRSAWPFNEGLKKAAGAHSAVLAMNLDKLPAEARRNAPDPSLKKLVAARSMMLALDLGKDGLGIGLRGDFPDEAAAKDANEGLTVLLMQGKELLQQQMNSTQFKNEMKFLAKPLQSVREALDSFKHQASGKAVTASTTIKTDWSVASTVTGAVQRVREAAARANSSNNLKQIGLALHFMFDSTNKLPIHGVGAKGGPITDLNGKPLLSWRVAILPAIEQQALYNQFKLDEPWDSEHNKKLIEKMPSTFASQNSKGKPGETFYQMVIGPKVTRPGLVFPRITDGLSNTIAVVEAANPVIWTKPDDILIPGDTVPPDLLKKFGGVFADGFNALFWDASVRFIRTSRLPADKFWGLLTPDGGEIDLP